MDTEEFLEANKTYKDCMSSWEKNRSKAYYLVMKHCPPKLKTELKNSTQWEEIAANQSVVRFLLAIQDVTLNKKDRRHGMMAFVEDYFKLYMITQRPDETLDEY